MKSFFLFLVVVFGSMSLFSVAQSNDKAKVSRVLILLDGSSSMGESWAPGKTRFQQAGNFILSLVDSLSKANAEVEFGLRVFGHQYPAQEKNCYDTKLEVKFSRYSANQMRTRLEDLHGYGVSPIAYSLSEAALGDFENENKYAYSIVLVTDGGESCDGDICKVVNGLLQRKIFFRPYIVSLLDYAPLKDLYSCLGTFLTVSTEPQMSPTITKIVDAHREGFERAKTGTSIAVLPIDKKPDTIVIPITIKKEGAPPKRDTIAAPQKTNNPIIPVKAKEEKPPIKRDTITIPIKIKEERPKIIIAEPAKITEPTPVLQVRDKRIVKPLKLNTRLRTYKTISVEVPMPQYLPVPPFQNSNVGDAPKIVAPPAPAPRPKEKAIPKIQHSKIKLLRNNLVALPNPQKLVVPPFVMPTIDIPKPETTAAKPIITPKIETKTPVAPIIKEAEKPIPKKTETSFVVEKTPATETLLEVFFTNGEGKFYTTSPQILLSDPATNKPAKQFYRTVNPEGNPDPIKVPSGTYNLSVVGSDRTFLKSVVIEPNMNNKVVIKVGNASLQFVWRGRKDNKKVEKYLASVKRNFVPQPTVIQRCDTILPYPPGNYHIEINTLPVTVRSVDLSFGATIIIPIEEPGFVQVSNLNSIGKVMFYFQMGDKFLSFLPMNITGNPATQKAEIMPGIYEVHFSLAPGLPEKTLVFHVKSNETTTIELQ